MANAGVLFRKTIRVKLGHGEAISDETLRFKSRDANISDCAGSEDDAGLGAYFVMRDDDAFEIEQPRYRIVSCTECGIMLPANQMSNFKTSELSGASYGSSKIGGSNYVDMASGRKPRRAIYKTSSRKHYKIVKKRLCPECFLTESERRKKELFFKIVGYAACAIFILWLITPKNNSKTYAVTENAPQLQALAGPADIPKHNPLSIEPQNSLPQKSAEPTSLAADKIAVMPVLKPEPIAIIKDFANVRSAPNNGPVIGQIMAGESVSVVEIDGVWANIRRRGSILGWVHRSLLARPQNQTHTDH